MTDIKDTPSPTKKPMGPVAKYTLGTMFGLHAGAVWGCISPLFIITAHQARLPYPETVGVAALTAATTLGLWSINDVVCNCRLSRAICASVVVGTTATGALIASYMQV